MKEELCPYWLDAYSRHISVAWVLTACRFAQLYTNSVTICISNKYDSNIDGLQPLAHAGSSLTDFFTLKMEAIPSSETSVHTRSTRHHNPEDGILQKTTKLFNNFYVNF
jgi:hypothetical protein